MDTPGLTAQIARSVSQAIVAADETKIGIARKTGIPYTTLGRKLLGRTEFTFSDLYLIAGALGVRPSRFTPDEFAEDRVA